MELSVLGVFVPLASAVVGGFIAAIVNYFVASKQIANAKLARAEEREFQLAMHYADRTTASLEKWWVASVRIQAGEELSINTMDDLLLSSLWLPQQLRDRALGLIKKNSRQSPDKSEINSFRADVIAFVESRRRNR